MRETLETIHAPKAGPPGSPALSTFDAAAPTGIKKIMRPGESRKISIPVPIPFSTPLPIRLSATRRAHNRGYCRAEDSERERRHHAFDNHADVDADTGRRRGSAPGSAAPAARDRAIAVKGECAIDAIRSDAGGRRGHSRLRSRPARVVAATAGGRRPSRHRPTGRRRTRAARRYARPPRPIGRLPPPCRPPAAISTAFAPASAAHTPPTGWRAPIDDASRQDRRNVPSPHSASRASPALARACAGARRRTGRGRRASSRRARTPAPPAAAHGARCTPCTPRTRCPAAPADIRPIETKRKRARRGAPRHACRRHRARRDEHG